MNLTASQTRLASELNKLLADAIPTISSPELKALLQQFEVKGLVLLEDDKQVNGKTEVDEAISQANQIQFILALRANSLVATTENPATSCNTRRNFAPLAIQGEPLSQSVIDGR